MHPRPPGDVPLAAPSFPCAFLNKVLKHASLTLLLFPSSPSALPTSLSTKPKIKRSSGHVEKGHHTFQHVTQDLHLTKQRLGHSKALLYMPSETISPCQQHTLDCFLTQQHSPALTTDAVTESFQFGSNLWRPCAASTLLKQSQLQQAVQDHVQLGFSDLQAWKSKTSA